MDQPKKRGRPPKNPEPQAIEPSSKERIVKGREPKGITPEQVEGHNNKMKGFYEAIKANRGFKEKYFSSPDELLEAIDGYTECIRKNGLFPTEMGLVLYLDCTPNWYYAVLQQNDERSQILEKYRQYISEFINQSGLLGTSNTIFSIYYLKSRMQQYDMPSETTINLNIGPQRPFSPADCMDAIECTPIEDYKEID